MVECIILGDSIAVGLYQQKKDCYSYSHGGYNSYQWNKRYGGGLHYFKNEVENVIISLGSNDHKHVKTEEELTYLRSTIIATKQVYWILPAGNLNSPVNPPISEIQRIVKKIAEANGDVVIPIQGLQKDGIHPSSSGYKQIAKAIK